MRASSQLEYRVNDLVVDGLRQLPFLGRRVNLFTQHGLHNGHLDPPGDGLDIVDRLLRAHGISTHYKGINFLLKHVKYPSFPFSYYYFE